MNYVSLADVAEINPRIDRKSIANQSEIVSFVSMADVSEDTGRIVHQTDRLIRDVMKGFTPFKDRDILIAKITPCFENGKIIHAHIRNFMGFGSTEFHVLRANKRTLNDRYLFHFLRQKRIRVEGERRMTGSAGQRRVPKKFFEELKLHLPPLSEQKRIAAILDKTDALREKRRQAIAKLDELLQSVFLDMFGDPVTNPKRWKDETSLGEVAEIVSGITVGRKLNGKATREIPYMAVVNVQDRRLNLQTIKTIQATEEEIDKYRLLENDLLLTEGGDPDKLGRGTLWKNELPESIHQNHIFRVRLMVEDLNPCFLNWLIGSRRGKQYFLRSAKQTTGIASINMTQLRNFPLLIPPVEIQNAFADKIDHIGLQQQQFLAHQNRLDSLFVSLQQRAFKGEL